MRVRLRVEHGRGGEADDLERGLFEGDELAGNQWLATPFPPPGTFVAEHGHVLADLDHVLLQDQVGLEGRALLVTSTVRLEGNPLRRVGARLERGGRAARALSTGAERLSKQVHEVADIFHDPVARAAFARAVRHPVSMTSRQQRALLSLVLLSSAWVWLVGLGVLALAAPRLAGPWNLLSLLYLHALGTNLFVPVPVEPVAVGAAAVAGTGPAVAAGGLGKMVGAWIIFTLGPTLRGAMARLEARSRAVRRFLAAAEGSARRFGYVALGLMLAVPFSPFDIVPVYLFSGMGLRLGPFLLAVFLGFAARLLIVVLLGSALLGLR